MDKDNSVRFDLIRFYRLCIRGDVGDYASAYLAIPLLYKWRDAAVALAVAVAVAASVHQSVSKFAVNGSSQKY